jgi:DNA invertase Pin-like site-specific DNA recombinase
MAGCRKGKIDLIITKSISRFGRNTLPFLRSVNELAEKGVTVYFENERIESSDPKARISNEGFGAGWRRGNLC